MRDTVQGALAREYVAGVDAGVRETLDQLEGKSKFGNLGAPPLTPEIREWIAQVRESVDGVDQESVLEKSGFSA